jgi:hypothetical protein
MSTQTSLSNRPRKGLVLFARRSLRGKISCLRLEGVRIIALEVQIARQSFRAARDGENRSVLARVRVDEKLTSRAPESSVCSIA